MSQRRKSIRKAQKNQAPPQKVKTSTRQKLVTGAVILFALLFALSMFFSTPNSFNRTGSSSSPTPPITNSNAKPAEPQFVKEGELQFFKNGNITVAIDIEVANTAEKIEQGLMYRQRMDKNKGMLFIFPEMKQQGFWMKNTLMPLDIIYIDDKKTIVSIQKNTIPLSEQTLPSEGPAIYVLEVNAGFSDLHGLQPGDKIDFQVK